MASGYDRRGHGSRGRRRGGSGRGGRGRGGRGRPFNGGGRSGGNVVFGFNALNKLREADPDDIVLDLASERCLPAFRTLVNNPDMTDDMTELVVNVLARACDSNSPEYCNKLLVELHKSLFVMLTLKRHITKLGLRGDPNASSQLFIENTVRLFTEVLKRIPSSCDYLPLADLELAVVKLSKTGQIGADVIQNVEQFNAIKQESLEKEIRKRELEEQRQKRSRQPGVEAVGPPPEDFRELTIIPEHDDIFTERAPYLRKNIVQGGYQDMNHYLDVQFRLLREDFLRPLREGILNLVNQGIDQRKGLFKDIRMYRDIKILYPVCSNKGLLHQIQFDTSRLKRVKWEHSKRLIFGSLLCLSKDNFQTLIFATVADRDPKELVSGRITVQFMDITIDLQDFSRKNVYQMVETTAYFEAYSPILEGLKQTEDSDLPFQRYLIDCNKEIEAPRYIRSNRFSGNTPSYDFSSILMDDASSAVSRLEKRFQALGLFASSTHQGQRDSKFQDVPVLDLHRWPSMQQLGLDESQYEALKIALTKEVAVIQGPPGTGKTYLGLKIAKLLLNNTETWIHGEQTLVGRKRQVSRTPILVICLTNHALDQFLEGIYDFYGKNEDKIVRIGGRSKSEKLKDCMLKAIKEKNHKKSPKYVGRSLAQVHAKLDVVKRKMETSANVIKKCWQNVLYESTLEKAGVVQEHHLESLMSPFTRHDGWQSEQGTVVLQWLNLIAGEELLNREEVVLLKKDNVIDLNGTNNFPFEKLPMANEDFSFYVNIKTTQAGTIFSSMPGNRRWSSESKALCVDRTGFVRFISGEDIVVESYSRVDDDRWHEIGLVYSGEEKSLAMYIDKRIERVLNPFQLQEESEPYQLRIGLAPTHSNHEMVNFVGSITNFIYYFSTKYNEMVRGDEHVEYEIDFMQDQRKIDDGNETYTKRDVPIPDDFAVVDTSELAQGSGEWQLVQDKKRARGRIAFQIKKELQSEDVMTDEEEMLVVDLWELPVNNRWRLYRKWVREISQQHQNTIASIQDEYDRGMKELQELYNARDYELLREAHVIGMTTTGAAKYRKLLHRIKPKITIVEEAAEVLESHIVTALTGGCEHLILIGDHKQLRPKPTVFQLGLDYQLDISLFERMVDNDMPFACLKAQHRMRPEISVMMAPIYDNLIDHESVLNFERIKGINKNIFFVDHQFKEDALDENQSHSNIHEAKFIGALCQYLLQQGYPPSQVTVLTPYSGQLFQLKKFVPQKEGLRVCVVDNFQGEENDIILLSLVRSQVMTTKEKREIRRLIGFLSIDNRICVSLSRAKKGFFCIGNLTLMKAANDLWSEILDDMERRGWIGASLPLACQNHPKTITLVKSDMDFKKAPNGGCSVLCRARLDCGHSCEQICHPTDPNHEEYDCRKSCPKKCERGHPCERYCYQDCQCMVKVFKVIPKCNHSLEMPCHQDPSTFQCTKPCPRQLDCGHDCPKKCGQVCPKKCVKLVPKTWALCGHTCNTACFTDTTKTGCPKPCGTLLMCEHVCGGTCSKCKRGRLHQPCSSKCDRLLFCGHKCRVTCTKNCPPCREPCQNTCSHSKCQKTCGMPCEKCNEPCQWKCEHLKCTKLCGEMCNRLRCNKRCMKSLQMCGHQCAGLCGEPCPNKCLVCNKEELTEIFFGHEDEKGARFLQLVDCGDIFERKGLDQYIDKQDKEMKSGQSTSIQMIKCPKCQTPIRTSLRYGNIVKKILRDFEGVKSTISRESYSSTPIFRHKMKKDIECITDFPDEISKISEKLKSSVLTAEEQNIIENQVHFLTFMSKLKDIIEQAESIKNRLPARRYHRRRLIPEADTNTEEDDPEDPEDPEVESMKCELKELLEWVMKLRFRFGEQELEEFNDELERALLVFTYLTLSLEIRKSEIRLSETETRYFEYIKATLETGTRLTEKTKQTCTRRLKTITKNNALGVKYTTVTEEERNLIVKAVGLSKGHWFKCPKGHIYCIGECGGATEESQCPECRSRIGGTQHRLLPDNSLAPEMDGASHAAWSDTANNMGNWNLNNL
ncbi:NFX1-type zinc finger-containing protein 1-like [Dendronephthya gigantea]|uniref:NFX1-type zinc finger-containing protein 1-like n=1 Tax=Dendronephthya gigantea TaxID=151771 RepID=UPI00106B2638|nr:NFX1-type zinc finger-containing protein 1-like [Dendronephthya gigantea]